MSSNCQLCAVKVLNSSGSGSNAGVIAGVNHVVTKCPTGSCCIANMSLGGGYSAALNSAVNNAVSKGIVMVVAAGNDNKSACLYSPASAASAITVGSTTSTNYKSSFSNWGSCVDVFAPGSAITSAWNTDTTATKTISGTSMATPRKFLHLLLRRLFVGYPPPILLSRFYSCRCCWNIRRHSCCRSDVVPWYGSRFHSELCHDDIFARYLSCNRVWDRLHPPSLSDSHAETN